MAHGQMAQNVDEIIAVLVHVLLIPAKHRAVVEIQGNFLSASRVTCIANYRLFGSI